MIGIRVIENEKEFINLKEDWSRLSEGLISFNKFDWVYKWWQYFKDGNGLKIIVASNNGRVKGIAPLYIENTKALKVLPFKKVCFLGGKISDYLDFMIEQDSDREVIFDALMNYIQDNIGADLIELRQINTNYPNFDLWQKRSESQEFLPFNDCPRLRLSGFPSYEEFYSRMNKSLKNTLKLSINRLKKNGANVEYIFKNSISKEDIDIIADINIKRQKYILNQGRSHRFSYFINPKTRNFIEDYFTSKDSESNLLGYIKYNGTVISYILVFQENKTISYWSTGFDPDYDAYSPTKLLINEAVKYAFNNGYEYFDFLRGPDKYKLQWCNEVAQIFNLIKPVSPKARLIYLYRSAKQKFAAAFKQVKKGPSLEKQGDKDAIIEI